jgi:Na+-driven multidrug efflux pump
MCMAALTALGLLVWASGPVTLRLFSPGGSDGASLIASAMSAMPVLALSQPFMAASIVLGHALRGAGDTRSPLLAAIAGGVVVRLSLASWLGFGLELGLVSVWIASGVDWVCRALVLGAVFARGRWAQIRL